MQRVYRFELIEERYRAPENAILQARDSSNGSMVILCEWTPRKQRAWAADADKLAEVAGALSGPEFFTAGSSFYLSARDDRSATAALEKLRPQGWFPGQWPGLIAPPVESIPVDQKPTESVAHPEPEVVIPTATTPRGKPWGVVVGVVLAFAAGLAVMAVLSQIQTTSQPPAIESKAAVGSSTESAPKPEQLPVSQPSAQESTAPPTPSTAEPPAPSGSQAPEANQEVPAEIMTALERWRTSMLASDADALTDCYAPVVELFFRRKNLNRETLRKMERGGINAWPHVDQYQLSAFAFEPISEDRGAVTFHKLWDSWDPPRLKHFTGEEKQRLTFEKVAGEWKIVREEELVIDWVKKQ